MGEGGAAEEAKEARRRFSLSLLRAFLRSAQAVLLSTIHYSTGRAAAVAALWAATAAAAWAQPAADWIIETVAGPGNFRGDGGAATEAWLRSPESVAVDAAGNLYIADRVNRRVRKVDAAGVITTVAGTGVGGFGGDGGPAVAAQLYNPSGVAVDAAGNLYIADRTNHRVRKVDAAGIITTVAGTGVADFSGDGGPAVAAQLYNPSGVAVDAAGNLYIADTLNDAIRKVDAAGVISTVAGTGYGYSGDGGPAIAARLYDPIDVAVDAAGNLYIADRLNRRVRKVDAAGIITTVAGTGVGGYSGDGGPAVAARLSLFSSVAVDAAGNLYIVDTNNRRIRKVDAAGVITTVAGSGGVGYGGDGGPATAARLNDPVDVAVDAAGNLYIADRLNHRVRKVNAADGVIVTAAGTGAAGFGDGGPATAARLVFPTRVAVDGAGNLYIADTGNHRVRKVNAAGVIATVAGTGESGYNGDGGRAAAARLYNPEGVALDGAGNLYIADRLNNRVRKVDAAGIIATVAGSGRYGYSGDGGPATAARLRWPEGVALDGAGNLYIADKNSHRIRKVDAAGVIFTVAGNGTAGYSGDGGPAAAAQLNSPEDMEADGAGNLYIADKNNHRVRKVDAAGVISTVAGSGTAGYSGDGGAAAAARLNRPEGVALDGAGNLYIADRTNLRIRKVDAAGVIATVAGSGGGGYGGDGGLATAARLNNPYDAALDGAGNLYIADGWNHRIRRLTPPLPEGTPRISAGGVALATGTPVVARISPNAVVSVFGQDFAPQGTQAANPAPAGAGRVGANLAATCLEIGGKRAPLFAVFPTQINAQTPHDLTPGQVPAAVIRGCGTSEEQSGPAVTVEAAAVSPAFFNFANNSDGRNPIVAVHGGGPALAGQPGSIPGVELTPARPGEYVTLFGTGFGPTEPALETGQIPGAAALLANAVTFSFGGIEVPARDVLYAGASPCCAGLYQFTVRVPADVPDGAASVIAAVQGVATPEGPFLAVRRQ